MEYFFTALLAAMPAVTAGLFFHLVCTVAGIRLGVGVSFALGAYLGFLFIALMFKLSNYFGFSIFSFMFVIVLFGVTVLSSLAVGGFRVRTFSSSWAGLKLEIDLIWLMAAISLLALVVTALYQHVWQPLQSWDALSFWGQNALFILQADGAGLPVGDYWNRHPSTVSVIAAWSAWSAYVNGNAGLSMLPWLLTWLALGAITFSFGALYNLRQSMCLLLSFAAMTVPLLDNHAMLTGYGEIYHALGILLCLYFLVRGENRAYDINWWLGLILAATLIAYKNIGIIYAACIIFSAVFLRVWNRSRAAATAICLIFMAAVLVAEHLDLNAFWMNNRIGFDHNSDDLFFGGYRLSASGGSLTEILGNQVHSTLLNQSYSVALVALFMGGITLLIDIRKSGGALVIMTPVMGLILFSVSQSLELSFMYAKPGNDTGNSRFMLPFMALIPMSLAAMIARADSIPENGIAPQRIE